MKGRSLIFIFLFLALLLNPVSCESGNGSISTYVSTGLDNTENVRSGGDTMSITSDMLFRLNHDLGGIPDSYHIDGIQIRNSSVYNSIPVNLGDPFYIYWSANGLTKDDLVGYGSILIHKSSYAGDNNVNASITFFFDEFTKKSGETGEQYYILDGNWNAISSCYSHYYKDDQANKIYLYYNSINSVITFTMPQHDVVFATSSGYKNSNHEYYSFGDFRNDYDYELTTSYFNIDIQRQGFNESYDFSSSKIRMENLSDDSLYYQSGFTTSNTSHFLIIGDYNYYIVREIDDYKHLIYTTYEDGGEDHTAVIEFNQSFYTDPEPAGVEYDINSMDLVNFEYWINVEGTNGGNTWITVNEEYIELTDSVGQVNFTIERQWLTLPMDIQGFMFAYDKNTGMIEEIASTEIVLYNPETLAPGTVWTDKSNYNVTELVEISYTTDVTENYIAVEEPYSLWSTHDVPVGTYSFLYELSTSAVGNTTIYLFENSELADQVTISVSSESGDDAYAAWMKDYYFEGETASFYYYSSNASAQITVYDGADIVVFGPATTQLGYHNGRVNTVNTNPGTFLLSLYHNGTYYNDTMIFESVDSWVRFDSSKYNVGDTINIEYYLADPTHQISMWDAHVGLVIRFTTNYGVLVSGSMETVPFTLSEDNEYSYDVPGKLSSGDLTLGYWTVFIEERNGVLGDSWDEAYVCYATDDDDGSYGTDASNEMISIFFSPEGIFLLFTASLTMMGLVAAHHPAGGGAGAVVGVGFGVYFKVLPVWMLLLMVIAFVVLAGVSVAVYFKGK
ncbi:MAG: hypothetical protein KAT48_10775 [Bacteroidales bacterium]|nr:hypothetical protein [Bacteroidales bacterium]